jgi:hypothetical protein
MAAPWLTTDDVNWEGGLPCSVPGTTRCRSARSLSLC